MSFKTNLQLTLALIKNGYKAEKKKVTCKISRELITLLRFFLDRGYINGFFINKSTYLINIYLKYSRYGSPIICYFTHIQLVKQMSYISLKQLQKFYFHSYNYILSTDLGFLSGDKAVFFKRGGLYLFKL